jgi:hypothetical protein
MHKLAFFTLFIVNTSFGQVHTSWPKKDTKELSISVKEGPVSDDPFYDVVVAGQKKLEIKILSITSTSRTWS